MVETKFNHITHELKEHAPFTLFGALTGIVLMLVFRNLEYETSHKLFYIFHPAHVLLNAMVMTAMFKLHSEKTNFFLVFLIGFFGSLGIATLSDSLIPHIGELLLGMRIEFHEPASFANEIHIGFIESWQIVIPAAIIGVLIAYFSPKTKSPHAGHVLLSTWASSFHMLMAMGGQPTVLKIVGSFVFLFIAVWLPCCIGDIAFPLLFVREYKHK